MAIRHRRPYAARRALQAGRTVVQSALPVRWERAGARHERRGAAAWTGSVS